jgi:hypothetical protein
MNLNDDLGETKNSILVNYLGRTKEKWEVKKDGGLKQYGTIKNKTRLTKGIWGNEFGEEGRDTKFSSTTPNMNQQLNSELAKMNVQYEKSKAILTSERPEESQSVIKKFMKYDDTTNKTNFDRLENSSQIQNFDIPKSRGSGSKKSNFILGLYRQFYVDFVGFSLLIF